jgi:hypothetical protein
VASARSRSQTARLRKDPLFRLLSRLKERVPAWTTDNLGFHRNQVLLIDGKRWTVNYKIHAMHDHVRGQYKPWLRSSITVWLPSRRKHSRQDRRSRLREQEWCDRIGRALKQQGYAGKWRRFSFGRFGDYWRRLADTTDVARELRRLDRMELEVAESSVSFGDLAPRNARRKSARPSPGRGDHFYRLWSSFSGLQGEWRTSSFSLNKKATPTVLGAGWSADYRIYAHGERKLWSRLSFQAWPSRRAARTRGGWHPRLLAQGWYDACAARFRRLGYAGEWALSDVRYGVFGKRAKHASEAIAEVARLDRFILPPAERPPARTRQ